MAMPVLVGRHAGLPGDGRRNVGLAGARHGAVGAGTPGPAVGVDLRGHKNGSVVRLVLLAGRHHRGYYVAGQRIAVLADAAPVVKIVSLQLPCAVDDIASLPLTVKSCGWRVRARHIARRRRVTGNIACWRQWRRRKTSRGIYRGAGGRIGNRICGRIGGRGCGRGTCGFGRGRQPSQCGIGYHGSGRRGCGPWRWLAGGGLPGGILAQPVLSRGALPGGGLSGLTWPRGLPRRLRLGRAVLGLSRQSPGCRSGGSCRARLRGLTRRHRH